MDRFDLTKPLTIDVNTSILEGGVIETTIDMMGQITRRVLRTQEAQIRAALVALGWTPPLSGASPGQVDRYDITWPNPWDIEARSLGGWPSELCGKILIELSRDWRRVGMTADEIGKAARVEYGAGQVLGATSNMVNKKDRHWISYGYSDGGGAGERLWFLTDRGRRMVELMGQKEAANGG